MSIVLAVEIVAKWAAKVSIIERVYFFGSRVKRTNICTSDIDIAIKLIFKNKNTCLAHWMEKCEVWRLELSSQLPWTVDLQFLDLTKGTIVGESVNECSLLVYQCSDIELINRPIPFHDNSQFGE